MKGGGLNIKPEDFFVNYNYRTANNKPNGDPKFKYSESTFGTDKIFFGKKISLENSKKYFSIVLASDGSFGFLTIDPATKQFKTYDYDKSSLTNYFQNNIFPRLDEYIIPNPDNVHKIKFSDKMKEQLDILRKLTEQLKQKLEQQKLEQQKIEQDKNKIILKGFNPNVWGEMNLQYQGKIFTVRIQTVVNPSSYIFVDEKGNRPYGTFEDFIGDQNISSAVYREVGYNTKIVIKIGEGGSVAALLSDQNLPELNNISGKLSANTYQQYKSVINKIKANSRIEREEAERSARLYPNYN